MPGEYRQVRAIALLAFCLALGAAATGRAQGDGSLRVKLQAVVSGLNAPLGIVAAGDASGRLFIVEQGGRIRVYDGANLLAAPFLDVSALISTGGERGLLGLAFHPDYQTNGFFYINYTRAGDGATVVARYQVSSDPNLADPDSATILLTVAQPFPNHNGGDLHFGPDGYLYVALGDGGSGGDPGNRAQDLNELLGKLLRLDVDSAFPYAIPPTNPFVGVAGARAEIWAYGLRNPWRISFDRETGDLFIADVGQSSREEVNFQPAASPGGENYGWRRMEGTACFNPSTDCNDGTLTLPVLEYTHANDNCSVTGGYRYRGQEFLQIAGAYFFGDFCTGRLWAGTEADGTWSRTELLDTSLFISAFGEDEQGELYLADYAQGVLYRLVVPIDSAFRGHVLDAAGLPVARAAVEAIWNGQPLYSAPTNANGGYRLPVSAGTYDLVVAATGFLDRTKSGVHIGGALILRGIDFKLFRPSFFQGTVTDRETGAPLAGAVVEALRNGIVKFSTLTAADGTYSLQVTRQTYTLRASAPGYQTRRKRDQRIGDGVTKTGVNFALAPQ